MAPSHDGVILGNKQSTGVNFAFAAIGAFLVFTGIFLYTGLDRLNEDRASAIHTTKVIDNLQRLLADILDAEAGERAFLILRDDTAFARIESALARAEEHLAGLEILLNESSDQKQNLEHLRSLAHTRMQISRELLARTRSGGKSDLPSEYIQTTRIHMRDLRAHLAKISVNQYAELEDRTQKTEAMEGYVKLVLIASSLISILAIFAVSILFRRFVTQQNIEAARRAHEAWLQQNEAEIARVAINENSVERMAEPSIRILVEALKAIAGNLFIADGPHLKLVAGYGGVDSDSTNDKTFTLGRGLVGEAALGEDLTILKDVPENYFHLRSSLGSSAPKHIVFVPLRFQGQLVGLLEIASFISINEEGKALLRHLSTPLAAGFNAAINRDKQQSLLEETQIQAEELQAQQEELRTSNEELEQQSSALLESQARLQAQQEELQQNNEELEQQTRGLEEQQEFISKRNSELETIRTELESKAGDLARANTYKSEFLAKMSHELRTPLNSLMILATLLKENKQGNLEKQQIEFAETIHDAGADLLNLINDILDLSKLEARKLSARPENFQVRSMFDQLALTFRPLIDQKKLQLQLNIAQDTPETIYTDRQRLQQILTNFLSNAVKFTDEGNIVLEASLSDRAGFLKISVSDSGTGIAEEKRRLIFEAFEQGDGSISRKYGGTGLGLTISRELSVLLGGSISVTSEIGKGSQFTIEIPIDLQTAKAFEETGIESGLTIPKYEIKPQSAALQAPLASTPSAMADDSFAPIAKALVSSINPGDRTILIVEDELNFRSAIADAARAQGFTPIEAGDAETALAVVKIHTPKAIMLDIKLPGLYFLYWLFHQLPGGEEKSIHLGLLLMHAGALGLF
ncbi:MAG: ATP-binding protein, partial [Bdellovibrionota bacterium]